MERNKGSVKQVSRLNEKKKWQIALRRYVLDRSVGVEYAPYFGLDNVLMRKWFEVQFTDGISWDSFALKWQFDHIVPVMYFDFLSDDELRLCWNFTNLKVGIIDTNKEVSGRGDISAAREYFKALLENTGYDLCEKMLAKIDSIMILNSIDCSAQVEFINQNTVYLNELNTFSSVEFEMINRGKGIEEVKQEIAFIKKFG